MTTLEGYGFDWQQFQKDMKEKAGCKDGTRQDGEAQNNNVDTPKPNGPGMALSGPSRLQVNITRALEDMSDTINSSGKLSWSFYQQALKFLLITSPRVVGSHPDIFATPGRRRLSMVFSPAPGSSAHTITIT